VRDIIEIENQFQLEGNIISLQEYGKGNINKTFLITIDKGETNHFILQRINRKVFKKPEDVMQNMRIVTDHIHNRCHFSNSSVYRHWKVPRVIQTHENQDYWIAQDKDKTFWRVISFIENSESFDTIDNTEKAIEIGCALGTFHNLISDLPAEKLIDTLEGFHITPHYINHYDRVVQEKRVVSSPEINYCIQFVNERRVSANILEGAKANGKLHLRIIHGDPKINNIMIEKDTGKAISIIDLDTVKPGLIHYDIGDCLRSGCNPLGEEAGNNWESVYFETDICRSILKGYISQAKIFLTESDYNYLYDSIRLIAFELGLRFFTDYLEGNVYFQGPKYPEQNLFRSLVQFKLTESIEFHKADINHTIKDFK
jgi:Ser/Thr protein kinase RdoA (MazF antagonist)